MTQVDFYHLTSSELDAALIMLLKKTLAAGKKALIMCPTPAASGFDDLLWTFEPDAWVPHGVDDGDGQQQAKVWISTDPKKNQIAAPFLFLTHGVMPGSWDGIERAFVLFDGRSDAQVQQARGHWKEVIGRGELNASYFAQDDDGRWQKKG